MPASGPLGPLQYGREPIPHNTQAQTAPTWGARQCMAASLQRAQRARWFFLGDWWGYAPSSTAIWRRRNLNGRLVRQDSYIYWAVWQRLWNVETEGPPTDSIEVIHIARLTQDLIGRERATMSLRAQTGGQSERLGATQAASLPPACCTPQHCSVMVRCS